MKLGDDKLPVCCSVSEFVTSCILPAGCDFEVQNLVLRRIYPFILGVVLFVAFCMFQARQFRRLYEHIKNDKYVSSHRHRSDCIVQPLFIDDSLQ